MKVRGQHPPRIINGCLMGDDKPLIHCPSIGVEHGIKTTRWFERRGVWAPPGTPAPGDVVPWYDPLTE